METKSCKAYRDLAWDTMSSHWNEGVVMMLILILCGCIGTGFGLISTFREIAFWGMFGTGVEFVLTILLIWPLLFAFSQVLLGFVRQSTDEQGGVGTMLRFFTGNYTNLVVTGALMYVVLIGLAFVTLGIGTIIFGYAYAMVPFVLKDNPELSPKEALYKSRMMMRGHKWDLFVLQFSFIGWCLLGIITCGIAFLWVGPYASTAMAHFYEDIKGE